MMAFKTASGSEYLLDEDEHRIQRVVRSADSTSERLTGGWKPYQRVLGPQVGQPVYIIWGSGTDEHSPEGIPAGDPTNLRMTVTSEVVELSKP